MKSAFVTVGSTSFDFLIDIVCSEDNLKLLKTLGFEQITFQIGNGTFIPSVSSKEALPEIKWYRFKDSLSDDIRNASLIIGHASADTIMESLLENKTLIFVFDTDHLDAREFDLVSKLSSVGYLQIAIPLTLMEELPYAIVDVPRIKAPQNVISSVLERVMSFK